MFLLFFLWAWILKSISFADSFLGFALVGVMDMDFTTLMFNHSEEL